MGMFGYMTTDYDSVEMTEEQTIEAEGMMYTVYREIFAPVLFSPFSPSYLRSNLKLGELNYL